MMAKRVNIFIAVILITFMGVKVEAKKKESHNYPHYVDEVTSSFLKQMRKEFDFACEASGGSMPDDVQEISVQLVAFRSATLEQARELEVIATEKFIQIINAHEKLKPFLREYPFPSSRVRVAISFRDPKKKNLTADNNVTFVFQAKNKIFYQQNTPDDLTNPYGYKNIKIEPYEEALKIVQSNSAKNTPPQSKNI